MREGILVTHISYGDNIVHEFIITFAGRDGTVSAINTSLFVNRIQLSSIVFSWSD